MCSQATQAQSILQPFVDKAGAVVLDGGLATELEKRGANLNDDLWSARLLKDDPGLIAEVHKEYYRAGADAGISASYQATTEGLIRDLGVSEAEATELLKRSVTLLVSARDEFWDNLGDDAKQERCKPLAAVSVGPYGAFKADGSEYRGGYDIGEEELMVWHKARLDVIGRSGGDILAMETVPCLDEVKALLRVLDHFEVSSEEPPNPNPNPSPSPYPKPKPEPEPKCN